MDWVGYIQSELPKALAEAEMLKGAVEDEREPYKNKYAGADLLKKVIDELQVYIDTHPQAYDRQSVSTLRTKTVCERGLFLLETDLAEQGEPLVLESLEASWPTDIPSYLLKQRAYNALGALYCSRTQFEESQQQLEAAVAAFKAVKQLERQQPQEQQQEEEEQQPSIASINQETGHADISCSPVAITTSSSSSYVVPSWPCGSCSDQAAAAEAHYTTSLYYLAQLHGLADNKDESAIYCAATLNRQIQSGVY